MKRLIMSEDLKIMGMNIEHYMNMNNISNKTFSELAGYDRNGISKLLRGEKDLRLSTALRISKVLNVDFYLLFSRSTFDDPDINTGYATSNPEYLSIFINNTYRIMNQRAISQVDISRMAYDENGEAMISAEAINRILKNKVSDPHVQSLSTIAKALNTTLEVMFKKED